MGAAVWHAVAVLPVQKPLKARAFDTVILGGLAAGVLDILDAFAVAVLRRVQMTLSLNPAPATRWMNQPDLY
jgi:hypothetical protein